MGFEEKVWNLAKKVPEGRVTTYGMIARKLGTKAYRAVGNALNRNHHGFMSGGNVPCHRVVKSDGSVGGFAHGSRKKIELLKKEGIRIRKNMIVDFDKVLKRL